MKKSILIFVIFVMGLSVAWGQPLSSKSKAPREVTVTSTNEFLAAIAPNTVIYIDMLEMDPIVFESKKEREISRYCKFEEAFDGYQLVIQNVNGLSIIGPETVRARILTPYSYANVMVFRNCSNLELRWLNCGHDMEGYCTGGVLAFDGCSAVSIRNCDLWGCGTVGLDLANSWDFDISYTTIRDCSYGIMYVNNCEDIRFSYCLMHDNREFDLMYFTDSQGISFEYCVIWNNRTAGGSYSQNLISISGSEVSFYQCTIFNNAVEYIADQEEGLSFESCVIFGNEMQNWDW